MQRFIEPQISQQRTQKMVSSTISALETALERYVSESIYRKFFQWCLSKQSPQRKVFTQVLGVPQLVNLTHKLFAGLLSETEWDALLPFCSRINAYLTYEAISDNVALGLARPKVKEGRADDRPDNRREVLTAFNTATVKRLQGEHRSASALLAPIKAMISQVSLFKSSLSPEKLLYLAASSVKQTQNWSIHDLNASLQVVLVANAETCSEVANEIAGLAGADLVRQGLVDRYTAVNTLLANPPMTVDERVHIGTQAVLVAPTIGYYLTVLANKIRPTEGFAELVEDGTLEIALYDAALLVRLLNDIGTPVLKMSATERKRLVGQIQACWETQFTPAHTLFEVLGKFTETCIDLTRIRKDTLFGEYNLALDLLPQDASMTETLTIFEDNLNHYGELYTKHWQRLKSMGDRITDRLQDDRVSQVILRFVKFHEMLYSNAFDSSKGEYAV